MASELIHRTDGFTQTWYSKPQSKLQGHNVQSNLTKGHWMGKMQKRPHFLRLGSNGESADSSPESEESVGGGQKRRQTNWDTNERRFRTSNSSLQQEVVAKARRTANSYQFQGNNSFHSKESLTPRELDLLAAKFNSCSTNPLNQDTNRTGINTNCQDNMSHCTYNQDNGPRPTVHNSDPYQPQNIMRPIPNLGLHNHTLPSDSQQIHNEAALSSFINMSVFRPNFIHQPFQRWHQPVPFPHHRPPVIQPPQGPPQTGYNNSPFYHQMPCGPAPPLNFNFFPHTHRAQFTQFRSNQQIPYVHVKEQKQPYCGSRKKNSNREKTQPRMFTKILQRPPQKETSEKKFNVLGDSVEASDHAPVTGKSFADTQVKSLDVRDKKNNPGAKRKCSSANVETINKCISNEAALQDSVENKPDLRKFTSDEVKQRHSSIEYLLSSLKSGDHLSDSDFVDCDWDALDMSDEHSWDEYFLSNDPLDPLNGWRCQKGCPKVEETESGENKAGSSSSQWSHRSQDFDSGTESGSEGETDSDSDGNWEGEGENVQTSGERESVCSSTKVRDEADSCKSSSELTPREIKNTADASDTARRQKCLHPSISYVLGGYGATSEKDSEDESDDWDSFDDSDEERDHSNLFQFSNHRFPPLSYFLRDPLDPPKVKSSPSVPCRPIFKPKARTVLISQRIICQVSDRPVSMIVPLEQNGRMSQNSMPTIQVSERSSPKVLSPESCLKSASCRETKSSKKVHFSNKAILIVCPEPSHLIDEIRNTRRGPWLDFARDRCRFQHRIQHLDRVIGPSLSPEHRKKILERIEEPQATP